MTYTITITLRVKGLRDIDAAESTAISLTDHIRDTFNDDGSVSPRIEYHVAPHREAA